MTATWDEMNKSLDLHAKPDHLPIPEWYKDIAKIEKECEAKGIPYVAGRRYSYTTSSNYNDVRW